MSQILTYVRRYIRRCFIESGSVYCIHNPDSVSRVRDGNGSPDISGRATRRENFKTVA